jgi:tRNA threonylcarbamoyladenosine biosynthesis protein TsaB
LNIPRIDSGFNLCTMRSAVLGIDTSGTSCSVALARQGDATARRAVVGNAHSQHVLAMVRDVLAEASLTLVQCDAIAYAAGPGSFTGLRVACAVAQGLAFGAGLPVVPVGTLEAIARSALATASAPAGEVLVAMDARMGEVYWSLIEWTPEGIVSTAPAALASPVALRAHFDGLNRHRIALGCGNAWAVHHEAMHGLVERVIHRDAADAIDVAYLGQVAYRDGKTIAPDRASPLYVRDDVALTTMERAARRESRAPASSHPQGALTS